MRASTGFFVGIGTVGLAIAGGLGGGFVIANMMTPLPPRHQAETALPRPPQPMPASAPLSYMAATMALTNPSIDGSAPPSADKRADSGTAPPPASVSAAVPGDQTAKAADSAPAQQPAQDAQQSSSAKQASTSDDAYAKATDSDLKHDADKRRAERAQRWARRHAQNRSYDRRYRDADREDDDRAQGYQGYYVYQAPRFGYPRVQMFGPDN